MRDELLYGDQFQNVVAFGVDPINSMANHIVPLPAGDNIKWKYPTEAIINGFFTDAAGVIMEDGYVQFGTKGFEVDYTQARIAESSAEHTSELQSLMRISYAVFCLEK